MTYARAWKIQSSPKKCVCVCRHVSASYSPHIHLKMRIPCLNSNLILFSFPAGFSFFESANKVILCPGDKSGFLPVEYFEKVLLVKGGES